MTPATTLPGFRVISGAQEPEAQPLRTDIAGFVGRSLRGPARGVVRVAGSDAAIARLGPIDNRFNLGWSLRGYFANGGDVAHVRRLVGPGAQPAQGALTPVGPGPDPEGAGEGPPRVLARDPGAWANGGTIELSGERRGAGPRRWTWRVEILGEPVELISGVPTTDLLGQLAGSAFVALQLDPALLQRWERSTFRRISSTARLERGNDGDRPGLDDYRRAAADLLDQEEVALVVLPDLSDDLGPAAARQLLVEVATACDAGTDRLLLADLGRPDRAIGDVIADAAWVRRRAGAAARSVAAYQPWILVDGGAAGLVTRAVPATGHVAGLASRLDRTVGPGRTPANGDLEDLVDLAASWHQADELSLWEQQVNLLRCMPARGLQVWGGRTLDLGTGRFVAHRRLIHRLVRAFRRAALPLLFESNGPEVRLALRRAVTSVLLQAHRSGALAGASPQASFEVRCDETTTTAADVDAGRLICIATFVPADPIEHITIRLALGASGHLEVSEL